MAFDRMIIESGSDHNLFIMSRNDKKRGLLENGREKVEMEEEWIELDDFRTTPNPYVLDKKPSQRKVSFN